MSSIVTYEFDLKWGVLYDQPSDINRKMADEIETFNPRVPINKKWFNYRFTVDKDKKHIYAKIDIDKKGLFEKELTESNGWEHIIDDMVIHRLKDVFFAINLAYPGSAHVFRSPVYRDGCILPTDFSYSSDISSSVYSECKWITFESLSIQQCWDWLTSKTNFLLFVSRTSIDRALFALSYESIANEDMYIFYILYGIEAIYNNGSNKEDSIMEQLRRKCQFLLGQLPHKAIKSLNEMYNMRSKLVHGCSNIYKCWPSDDCEEKEFEVEDERQYMITATGILLATIQKFIKANANTLVETNKVELK